MSNFFHDNSDILFHINNIDLSRIIELKEDHYKEKNEYPEAPQNEEDAIDNYKRVLEIVGEISGEFIAPRAPDVDQEGATFKDGEVHLAKGTAEALDLLTKADLMGFTLPRKYQGLNIPKTIYSMAIEMISRADASLMNIFGLQDIADTICKFGSEEQKEKYLSLFSTGKVQGSMALTEPDAGSDLQAAMLKATEDENGEWRLNGVKRFITNGCADISLVMARSEASSTDARGLSLFIYKRDKDMKIRRIEKKLGIHGSPTCELQFNNAKAELLGRRKFGLIKYTMSLMNGARMGVSAQAVGIAEAAYQEANSYAKDRVQFKKSIQQMAPVFEMLTDMKVSIEAGRALLYETSKIVDIKEGLEERIEKYPELRNDIKRDLQRYTKFASVFTPITKAFTTEMANKVCYDSIQVHGGVGLTCDFNIERHYRDVRVTNIYEGTTQLQVVAAIGGIMSGVLFEKLNEYENDHDFTPVSDIFEVTHSLRSRLEHAISFVKEENDLIFQDYHARRLVDMSADLVCSYLFCIDSLVSADKKKVAQIFISKAKVRIQTALDYILSKDRSLIDFHEEIIK